MCRQAPRKGSLQLVSSVNFTGNAMYHALSLTICPLQAPEMLVNDTVNRSSYFRENKSHHLYTDLPSLTFSEITKLHEAESLRGRHSLWSQVSKILWNPQVRCHAQKGTSLVLKTLASNTYSYYKRLHGGIIYDSRKEFSMSSLWSET
jgi:hypothetical protein